MVDDGGMRYNLHMLDGLIMGENGGAIKGVAVSCKEYRNM
jgi:hypothetical protein